MIIETKSKDKKNVSVSNCIFVSNGSSHINDRTNDNINIGINKVIITAIKKFWDTLFSHFRCFVTNKHLSMEMLAVIHHEKL